MPVAFLSNIGSMLSVWFLIILFFILAIITARLAPNVGMFQKFRSQFFYGTFLRTTIESFLEIIFGVFLQFTDLQASGGFGISCVVLAFVVFVYFLSSMVVVYYKVWCVDVDTLKSEEYLLKFGTLYEFFQVDSKIRRSFLLFQNGRRILFMIALVFLQSYPLLQVSLV